MGRLLLQSMANTAKGISAKRVLPLTRKPPIGYLSNISQHSALAGRVGIAPTPHHLTLKQNMSYFSRTINSASMHEEEKAKELHKLITRLRDVDTAALCDADKSLVAQRHDDHSNSSLQYIGLGLMNPLTVRPINDQQGDDNPKMVGVARTVQCTRPNDFLAVLQGLDEAKSGEVLVVNTLDSTRAVAGGLFLTECQRKNIGGIIIDGPVRDISVMNKSPILCYATSVTPYSGTVQCVGETQVPIVCGGVKVMPGDILVGDLDGVVVGSQESFERVLDSAENVMSLESTLMSGMDQGIGLHSMSNFKEHLQARKEGQESLLEFRKKRLVSFKGTHREIFK
uniref:Dimethylmenaquinone methyltransferase n=1 Tax=Helicotheca tamesis TaxID=374047 RepID=A0A7S2IFM5_9STRA|mmetsp:Transcript_8941/g.12378  ORF Transcript_8941/g.12378 Transcript_8941/m.12378 type:complete len:340 (+) Transcript_8941:165-1184(+)|eukprot:CAMPEP_0185727836 /NCGR_PEP_ID=MMETSP1171-20130828/3409_1 /TAXON_ID=374046 /ORGANISM="Helicotheca tamensis, Strain CCMP826" /LENGTH=339 /DNA_ID=CAMNT_0028396473 /DNA_START=139 /DNA_END=1158 /DNA_ORIENTATION=+